MSRALRRWIRCAGKIAFLALAAAAVSAEPAPREAYGLSLYPGVTDSQSTLAHAALGRFHNGDLKGTEALLRQMDKLEKRESWPPLSRLLLTAVAVIHLQRDDAENPEEARYLEKLAVDAAEEGLAQCRARRGRDATCLLIQGGVQGFMATMKIASNPPRALTDGLQALKFLERALNENRRLRDAHMGVGIFHTTAANASLVVRATLKVLGRSANMEKGLQALRLSAYTGQYTTVASQFFLAQFLNPYDDELRREKQEIFRSLGAGFPESAYPVFLRWEEALCFYPDSFYKPEAALELEKSLRGASGREFAARRYLELAKHQYTLQPKPNPALTPDSTGDLGNYAYYPVFVQGLRARRELNDNSGDAAWRGERLRELEALKDSALALLDASDMSSSNRRRYAWHIRDAFRPALLAPVQRPQIARPDSTLTPKNE